MITVLDMELSIWGILLAAVLSIVVGMLWYSPALFGKTWLRLVEKNAEDLQMVPMDMVKSIVSALLLAIGLNVFIGLGLTYLDMSKWAIAVLVALKAAILFTGTSTYNPVIWEGRKSQLYLFNMGNFIVSYVVMALAIVAFY